jgi:hypothetical protein
MKAAEFCPASGISDFGQKASFVIESSGRPGVFSGVSMSQTGALAMRNVKSSSVGRQVATRNTTVGSTPTEGGARNEGTRDQVLCPLLPGGGVGRGRGRRRGPRRRLAPRARAGILPGAGPGAEVRAYPRLAPEDGLSPRNAGGVPLRGRRPVEFENGRHRFAYFRDRGVRHLPVNVPARHAARFGRLYGRRSRRRRGSIPLARESK